MRLGRFLDGATHVFISRKVPYRLELGVGGGVSRDLAQPAQCLDGILEFDGDGIMSVEMKQAIGR